MLKPRLEEPPSQDLTLPNPVVRDLMLTVLQKGRPFRFRALGSSMSPFIRDGDVLIIQPKSGKKPGLGQVVAFILPESGLLMVHRVIQQRGPHFLVQGDNLPGHIDGMLTEDDILGTVTEVKRAGKRVWLGLGLTGAWVAWLARTGLLHPLVSRLRTLSGRLHKLPSRPA
jgi:signal peptidase I